MLGLTPAMGWDTGPEYYVRYGLKFLYGNRVIAIAAFKGPANTARPNLCRREWLTPSAVLARSI